MDDSLKSLVLRTMLMEDGQTGEKIISMVKNYKKIESAEKKAERKETLIGDLRKEVTTRARELMEDQQIEKLINEILPNV